MKISHRMTFCLTHPHLFHSQGAKKTNRIRSSSSQSSDMKKLVLPASTGATMILDDSSDDSEDIELPETERTVALYVNDSPLHKKQRREASSKHDECPYIKHEDKELRRTQRCNLSEPILDRWDEKDKDSLITCGEYTADIYAFYKKNEVGHSFVLM